MEFFAILIVLAAVQLWGNGGSIQQDDWFTSLLRKLTAMVGPRLRLALAIGLPVVGVLLLEWLFSSLLFGIPLLILYVVLLLYSLGRGDFSARLLAYLDCWRRGDLEGAYQYAMTLDDFDQDVAIENARELHESVRQALFYQGLERWFAVIFWFVLLGPAAALAYRLLFLSANTTDSDDSSKQEAVWLLHYAEWLPIRALGFSFALVGNFDRCIGAVREHLAEDKPSAELLDLWGTLALSKPIPDGLVDGHEYAAAAGVELNCAQSLLSRSLLCWVVIIALIQMI